MLFTSIVFIDFLKCGVHLIRGSGKQKHTNGCGIEELGGQHTGFSIRIGMNQVLETLEFVHDYKIRFQFIQADLSKHDTQFADNGIVIYSAVATMFDSLAESDQLFQICSSFFALDVELLVHALDHILDILTAGLRIAFYDLFFVIVAIPIPCLVGPIAHSNIQLGQIGFQFWDAPEQSKHQRPFINSTGATGHTERCVRCQRNQLDILLQKLLITFLHKDIQVLHGKTGGTGCFRTNLIADSQLIKILPSNGTVGADVDHFYQLIARCLLHFCQFGDGSLGNQSLTQTNLIRNQHTHLPATVELIDTVYGSLLEVLQTGHDSAFDFIEFISNINHPASPPFGRYHIVFQNVPGSRHQQILFSEDNRFLSAWLDW